MKDFYSFTHASSLLESGSEGIKRAAQRPGVFSDSARKDLRVLEQILLESGSEGIKRAAHRPGVFSDSARKDLRVLEQSLLESGSEGIKRAAQRPGAFSDSARKDLRVREQILLVSVSEEIKWLRSGHGLSLAGPERSCREIIYLQQLMDKKKLIRSKWKTLMPEQEQKIITEFDTGTFRSRILREHKIPEWQFISIIKNRILYGIR